MIGSVEPTLQLPITSIGLRFSLSDGVGKSCHLTASYLEDANCIFRAAKVLLDTLSTDLMSLSLKCYKILHKLI